MWDVEGGRGKGEGGLWIVDCGLWLDITPGFRYPLHILQSGYHSLWENT
jgi:hypothetical protein